MDATTSSDQRARRIALIWGALCHGIFALGGGAMMIGMYAGMTLGQGTVPQPWAWAVNALLILQFPLAHSFLLTKRGMGLLPRLAPNPHGRTLATSTFVIVASLQLLALFVLWTPSGIVWWRAEGWSLAAMTLLYAAAWGLLVKASWDAGPGLQSGFIGWWALWRGRKPRFPDMPETGLFRHVRQPIYVSFALTTWAVPVWTPDQLVLALAFTVYCLVGPLFKERRFERMFGARFEAYRARVPYWLPTGRRGPDDSEETV